jgi:phthalate 4,5-cis-dihydrodiol dehydrogenase
MTGLGVVGLGVATKILLPSILAHPEFEIVAVAEPREDVRNAFCADLSVNGYGDIAELCADPKVDAVYIASPHEFHKAQAIFAVNAGKHVMVEKPLALNLADCDEIIEAAKAAGVGLVVGHTNGSDAPVLELREIAAKKTYGNLRMIQTLNYSEYLYRPRRAEELDTSKGGGIMFNQFPHQVEIVRTIVDSPVAAVKANCGVWDERRPTEGAIMATLTFANGVVAGIVYNGYAHFDTEYMFGGINDPVPPRSGGRRKLEAMNQDEESEFRIQTGYLSARSNDSKPTNPSPPDPRSLYERFGVTIASFDHADAVPNGAGLMIYSDDEVEELIVPPGRGGAGRATVLDEFTEAIAGNETIHNGTWGKDTLAVCLAALDSSASGQEVMMNAETGDVR